MKKISLLLWTALVLVFLSPPATAQTNSTTVAEGSTTDTHLPIWGLWMNSYCRHQVIYPEIMLADMTGATISEMKFYTSGTGVNHTFVDTMQVQVRLGIADTFHFTSATFKEIPFDTVYTGNLSVVAGVMTITFATPYNYNGGHLLLDIISTVKGNAKSLTFKGIQPSNEVRSGVAGHNGVQSAITPYSRYRFIPQTTFTYTGGSSCLSPNGVSVTDISETDAVMHIDPRPGQSAWEFLLVPAGTDTTGMAWIDISDTTQDLVGLTENTAYTVYVRTLCGDGELSSVSYTNFRTACALITADVLPRTWNFESDNAGGNVSFPLPSCWMRTPYSNYPSITYPVYADMCHSGSTVLGFHTATSVGVASTGEIDTTVTPIQQLQVEFYARMRQGYTGATLQIGVISDPTDNSTFQVYKSIPITSTAYNEEPYCVMFNEFDGHGNRIGFSVVDPSTTIVDLYIDDLTLSVIPPCPKVQDLTTYAATESSIALTWHGLNNSYAVRYRTVIDTAWATEYTFSDSIEIQGLLPNTEYVIEVMPADCDSLPDSFIAGITAWTGCATLSVPYFNDFENDLMQHCWAVAEQGIITIPYVGNNYYPVVNTSTELAYSGARYLTLGAKDSTSAVIAAPKMNQNIESLRLKFYVREESAYLNAYTFGTLQLGLMTDPYDTSTFVSLATVPTNTTTYALRTYNFDQFSYVGPDYYIAFRYVGAGSDTDDVGTIYIDDVTITPNAICNEPTGLAAANISTTSADISWTGTADNHKVYYQTVGDPGYQSVPIPAGDSIVTLTGLAPSTHYNYYVASVCSDSSEAPSVISTFMTECGVHTVFPYHENFDNYITGQLPDCWQRIAGVTEGSFVCPYIFMNTANYHFSNSIPNCLIFNSYGPQQRSTAILPEFSEPLSSLRLTFDLRAEGAQSGTMHVGYMTNPADSSTFVAIQSISAGDYVTYNYQHFLVNYNGAGIPDSGFIAFRHESSSDWIFMLDNVTVDVIPTCDAPIQLATSIITSTTANISWLSDADSLTLHYKSAADVEYTTETILVDSANIHTMTGLNPSTTYTWYLSILCEGQEYVSETSTFTTECAGLTSVPRTWTFETGNPPSTTVNPLPSCWHRIHPDHPYVYRGSMLNLFHSGSYALLFNANAGTLHATMTPINPDYLSLDTLQLKFYARIYSAGIPNNLQIGVMEDPTDASTFTLVETVTIDHSGYGSYPHRVNFDSYTGNGLYIAFRLPAGSGNNIYVDDITLQRIPACMPVDNLTVTDTTENSATVSWTVGEDISEFTVEHKPASATDWQSQTTNFTHVTLDNLTPNTPYLVRVRPTCDPSIIYQIANFTTLQSSTPDTVVNPTVVTDSVSAISQTTATLHGSITNAGNQPITAQGFEWKAASATAYLTVNATGTAMTAPLTGLTANTGYTFRAFASTADTTVYGVDITFTTAAEDPGPQPDTCDTPTNLHSISVENHAITIGWDDNPDVNSWNIQYQHEGGSWNSSVSSSNSYTITGLAGHTNYLIRVQADCGDGNTSAWSETISTQTTNVGIGNHLENNVMLFPNPANTILNVQWEMGNEAATIELLDVYGKLIHTTLVTGETISINVSGLANGVYFVRVTTETGLVTKPFVVKR